MASIGIGLPARAAAESVAGGQATTTVTKSSEHLANTDIFMQLLVAQLKYQNPMSPADGVEFMTQLTQFSQLEQTIESRKELEAIRKLLEPPAASGEGDNAEGEATNRI
jgi:flagellar basal-body rod modification protein FlgD